MAITTFGHPTRWNQPTSPDIGSRIHVDTLLMFKGFQLGGRIPPRRRRLRRPAAPRHTGRNPSLSPFFMGNLQVIIGDAELIPAARAYLIRRRPGGAVSRLEQARITTYRTEISAHARSRVDYFHDIRFPQPGLFLPQ